jgi:3-oxoacyl-[acyl-carrier-protein] synthase-3
MAVSDERAGMRSLAVAFPSVLRTNEYYRARYPEVVAQAEQYALAKLWSAAQGSDGARATEATAKRPPSAFDATMAPYLGDPFRGAVERRVRAPGETAVSMERAAARGALEAAGLGVDDVDLTLVSSFVGDRLGVGDAAYLAKQLGLRTPAWNFESACSGSVVGLHMAASLVRAGDYRRVLVVCSTSNSVQLADDDTLSWFIGDGAGAFVVERAAPGHGVLGWKTLNSVETNDMFVIHSVPDATGRGTCFRTSAHAEASAMARDTAEAYLRACVDGALAMAGVAAADVDFWVFNTPNAWYADFCGRVLGVGPERFHSVYPRYANIGATLMPATLYHALHEGRVRPGQLVACYSVGSTSTASALVMRVGPIALGPFPARPGGEGAAEAR